MESIWKYLPESLTLSFEWILLVHVHMESDDRVLFRALTLGGLCCLRQLSQESEFGSRYVFEYLGSSVVIRSRARELRAIRRPSKGNGPEIFISSGVLRQDNSCPTASWKARPMDVKDDPPVIV